MTLGASTDTQDSSGKTLFAGDPSKITETQVQNLLKSFVGEQKQVPPMYSAKKSNGIPLYKLARNGITIERKPVLVHFYSIDFINMEENQVEFEVHCSAGTYIRTLCHDVGQRLGCGAHMSGLIRKQVGVFHTRVVNHSGSFRNRKQKRKSSRSAFSCGKGFEVSS